MKRADSLLRSLISDLGIEDAVRLDEIKRNWNTLFREPLSFHMTPAAFSRKELLIVVDSPVWLQELKFYKEDIMKKLKLYGVAAIKFRLGRVPTQRSKSAGRKQEARKITENGHVFIREAVAGIGDKDLKKSLTVVLEKALSSGRTKVS
jgi:hypothetical protein